MFIPILLSSFLAAYSSSIPGSCLSFSNLSPTTKLSYVCATAVDYLFYIPSGISLSQLNIAASRALGNSALGILPLACQVAFKKLVCANTYLKCQPGIDLTANSTWNSQLYSTIGKKFPVPFQRPCQSLCQQVPVTCFGFTDMLGITPNCTAVYDYSARAISTLPTQYDPSNNNSLCNNVPATVTTAGTMEPYLKAVGGGFCSGIATQIYIPPGPSVSSQLAPMQRPYVVQALIESQLEAAFVNLPPVLSTACRFSLRKFFCGSSLYRPQGEVIQNVLMQNGLTAVQIAYLVAKYKISPQLLNHQFYLPSYPDQQICLDYAKKCSSFIAMANNPALIPNCSAVVNSIASYPSSNQTLITVPLKIGATQMNIKFTTSPNKMADAVDTSGYAPPSAGTCRNFSASTSTSTVGPSPIPASAVCSDVVTYQYFLPTGYSESSLNSIALQKLNNSLLTLAPVSCQASIKKLVCSSVYLKCQPGAVMYDPMTWNWRVYGSVGQQFPVPFQRPCSSLCTDIPKTCMGLTDLIGLTPNCAAKLDYSGGMMTILPTQFDASNNPSYCNNAPANVSIAETKEPYLKASGGGFCSGIATTVFVPPATLLSHELAPMQPPYVVQALIESQLEATFVSLPPVMSTACRFSLRKFFCGSSLYRPQGQVIQNVLMQNGLTAVQIAYLVQAGVLNPLLLKYEVFVPSYPHKNVCEDYQKSCAAFITASGLSALVPNCSTVKDNVHSYPSHNQTILHLPLTLGSQQIGIDVVTSPNKMQDAKDTSGFSTACPSGFVVPEESPENDSSIIMVPGTGCAIGCLGPSHTAEEWMISDKLCQVASSIGLALVSILLFVMLADKEKRKQLLIILFSGFSGFASLWFAFPTAVPIEKRLCRNNAAGIDYVDGATLCAAQSVIIAYCCLGCCLAWLLQAADLFLKLVLNWKAPRYLWKVQLCISFLGPLPSIIYIIASESYGFGGTVPWCMTSGTKPGVPKAADIYAIYAPVFFITVFGVFCMIAVLWKVVMSLWNSWHILSSPTARTPGAASQGPGKTALADIQKFFHNVKILRTPLMFVGMFLVVWVSLFTFRGLSYTNHDAYVASAVEWTTCVFENFNGLTNESYESKCGKFPKVRPDFAVLCWVFFCGSGQSILVSLIYLPPNLKSLAKALGFTRVRFMNMTFMTTNEDVTKFHVGGDSMGADSVYIRKQALKSTSSAGDAKVYPSATGRSDEAAISAYTDAEKTDEKIQFESSGDSLENSTYFHPHAGAGVSLETSHDKVFRFDDDGFAEEKPETSESVTLFKSTEKIPGNHLV